MSATSDYLKNYLTKENLCDQLMKDSSAGAEPLTPPLRLLQKRREMLTPPLRLLQKRREMLTPPLRLLQKRREMLTPPLRLLQKRREAVEVHNAMIHQTEEFESTLRDQLKRKDMLSERESKMKENRQQFNNILKENEMKRRHAEAKADRERALMNQKQAEVSSLREQMGDLIEERERLEKRIQESAAHQTYLERVVQACGQFQEPGQVMSRFDTLMQTREDLVRTTQQNEDSTQNARAQLARFTEQSNTALLHLNNTLALLQSQLDQVQMERMIWESRWAHIQNTAAKKTLLLGTIKMATLNLYQSVWKMSKDTGEAPVAPEDTPQQLEKMQSYFANLMSILEHAGRPDQMADGH